MILATNRFVSTAITVALGGWLAVAGWQKVWPLFGSANQLLAAIALLSLAAWLANSGRSNKMIIYPMIFMFIVTLTALILLIKTNLAAGNFILVIFGVLLFVLALILIKQSYKILSGETKKSTSV